MLRYVLKRLLLMIPVLIGVSFIVFTIMSMTPGDPGTIILGNNATKEAVEEMNRQLGYYDPLLVKYGRYLLGIVQGDFGTSYRSNTPVFTEIFARFPNTLILASCAIVISVIIGVPIGIISAVKQYSVLDYVGTVVAMFLASVPQFWLGLVSLLIFAVNLNLLPSTGNESWENYILPVLTLALPCAAKNLRLTRSTMLETIRADYIRTAKAKGVPPKKVIWKHALQNALMPIITNIGINFGTLLGGTVVVESVFGMQGVGTLTMTSIRMKDIPQVMASVLFLAFTYSIMMLVIDIAYAYIDPRIKARYVR
ncbi:MAG TPA: ABC transporter permease [Candidatus Flavonifractor merdigallinarum]|uniref:ABC transporter permease n=1 Tax=Candidatus Flavonifractor merdigallinarum TaxID=2838589 RepID=A0A9D1Y860_9FIRM|nr:ABC transporter permease [Candidatus Flavonifractor merdigallinarum]